MGLDNNGEDLLFHMADKACVRAWKDEGWGPVHKKLLGLCQDKEHQGWKKHTGMTQNDLILQHMRKNGSISQREAMLDYSIQSLTRRIADLREAGWDIVTEYKTHPVTKQRYARYKFKGE